MVQNRLTKLELTWIGKDDKREALEPRILIEDSEYSFGVADGELSADKAHSKTQGMLIHGDNLLALKALEQEYAGQVKCIYIDPPYNTGNAFEHYDDGVEHSKWLDLMRPRLELLHKLLAKDGIMFISIDDDECHYLKVLCDEVFGRRNFAGSLIWEKKKKPSFLSNMGSVTEYILAYAKDKEKSPAFIYGETTVGKKYPFNNAGNGLATLTFPPNYVKFNMPDEVIEPQDMSEGKIVTRLLDKLEIVNGTNKDAFRLEGEWRYSQNKLDEIVNNNEGIVISKIPFRPNHIKAGGEPKKMKNLLSIAHFGISTYEDSTKESIELFGKGNFDYPKPEMLISILLDAVTSEGDLVLDSFLGSGTTAAVAHKMGRRWIGVELGEHAKTHCYPRLKMVCDGSDQGGISKAQGWTGGGSFRFYSLAPSLLNEDMFGNLVINKEYNADMLAAAMAKHERFTYSPDKEYFWKQGKSSENDYIYTTTQFLTLAALTQIKEQMSEDETLVICCKSYEQGCNTISGIKIKKIPQSLLGRCEFTPNGYPLNIIDLPRLDDDNLDDEYFEEEEHPTMHEDLVSLEKSWDRQEHLQEQKRLFE